MTYRSGRLRLFPVDLFEELTQAHLEGFVFTALVEFAKEVAPSVEGRVAKG